MSAPPLSNYLTVLAHEIRDDVAAFKRSSTAAHEVYLTAGGKLVRAREAARRGQWGPFLETCGFSERVARNMMALARSGLSAEDITERGGVQASLESLRTKSPPDEKPESDSGDASDGEALSESDRARRRRDERKAAGLCIDCKAPSPDHVRCDRCRSRIAVADTRRRSLARLGAHMEPRLSEAAERGTGIRLTASEVAALVAGAVDRARTEASAVNDGQTTEG